MDKKKSLLSLTEIILLAVISICILFLPLILSTISSEFSLDHNGASNIGSAIGGITAPFIGLLGSILVYIAFKVQYKANKDIQRQFEHQSNEQLFFRLTDSLYDRIKNTSTLIGGDEISGQHFIQHILDNVKKYFYNASNNIGRYLIVNHLEILSTEDTDLIVHLANSGVDKYKDGQEMINDFQELSPENRKEILRSSYFFNSDPIGDIGKKYFYKMDIHFRVRIYNNSFENIYKDHGAFLEGYFSTMNYLLKFIININNNSFYCEYINAILRPYEKLLIFYFCSSQKASSEFIRMVKDLHLLDEIQSKAHLIYRHPDEEIMRSDTQYVLGTNNNSELR